ncbi:MAG: GGDEF domain-containing protein [Proteobacteria bacterium]|nr:GGDEF domain-containing protein [Pseudomonadota bacterium]
MDSAKEQRSSDDWSLADGALDTLGCIFQTLGNESFPLDNEEDASEFPQQCMEVARHIENGSAVPQLALDQAEPGTRRWSQIRRFYVDRRQQENSFVASRLQDYRGVVEDLVVGLRQICEQSSHTERLVIDSLNLIENAVEAGELPEIKNVLADTIKGVNEAFIHQKCEYEQQIQVLNERMSGLRQDLVAAHEEMKLDALTSIYNRGAFDTTVSRCLNMFFVLNQPISLIMIDVDNFKNINDSHGHHVGDVVLKDISDLVRGLCRQEDALIRYGGEEYLVILFHTPREGAEIFSERVRECVAEHKFRSGDLLMKVTISGGIASKPEDDLPAEPEAMIRLADQRLYIAKRRGRNQIVSFDD